MKSLEELAAIKEKTFAQINMRHNGEKSVKIVVGMATCGIAAGARDTLNTFIKEIADKGLDDVSVIQTGCIGMCSQEPVVEVCVRGKEKVTYVKVDEEKARKIIAEHVIGGKICTEYTA